MKIHTTIELDGIPNNQDFIFNKITVSPHPDYERVNISLSTDVSEKIIKTTLSCEEAAELVTALQSQISRLYQKRSQEFASQTSGLCAPLGANWKNLVGFGAQGDSDLLKRQKEMVEQMIAENQHAPEDD